jgi:Tfp pilus assembly protein PilN
MQILKISTYIITSITARPIEKAYVISNSSKDDINALLRALGNIRSLLLVQAGRVEEELMKNSLK